MVGHKIKSGKKFCPLNFAQKCVFSSSEGLEAWKMKFQVPKSIFSKCFWCVHRVYGGFQKMLWGPWEDNFWYICLGLNGKNANIWTEEYSIRLWFLVTMLQQMKVITYLSHSQKFQNEISSLTQTFSTTSLTKWAISG